MRIGLECLIMSYPTYLQLFYRDFGDIPCSPTPVSPTLDQKVAFRLLIKNCIFGHQSDVKLHLEVGEMGVGEQGPIRDFYSMQEKSKRR